MYVPAREGVIKHRNSRLVAVPSWKVECAYYLATIYSILAPLGLEVPALGGAMLLAIAATCILQLRASLKAIYGPITLLLACAISFLCVQIVVHDVSITDQTIRPFIFWLFGLIIVPALCRRRGFSLRYPFFLFVVGAATLPFLEFDPSKVGSAYVNLGTSLGGGFLGGWFGFCAVFFAIFGYESRQRFLQIGAWLMTVGCLLVMTFSIARGTLVGTALALTVGLRSLLKRGFVPVLALVILAGIIYGSGLFDAAFSNYAERAMEETGREILWPAAIDRIFSSPLVSLFGVGEPHIVFQLTPKKYSPPHNAFLHFALSSGVVPFAFFLGFWIQAAWRCAHAKAQEADPFRMPYLIFFFLEVMSSDLAFMSPMALFGLSVAAGSAVYGKQHLLVVRVGNKIKLGLFPAHKLPKIGTIARPQS
jgi:O-antigen ligase